MCTSHEQFVRSHLGDILVLEMLQRLPVLPLRIRIGEVALLGCQVQHRSNSLNQFYLWRFL